MLRFMPLAAVALLAACTAKAPITQPPVEMSFAETERTKAITGVDTVNIRARLRTGNQSAELANVPCRLSGPGFSAQFLTPASVELPVFGNTAPQLALSCEYEGETKSSSLNARNVSEDQRREDLRRAYDRRYWPGGGVFIGVQFSRRGPDGFDIFRYPDRTLTFNR
ncbi:MAG: hypothetical protein AAGI10_01630 [Pseudomonadota bacterium]